MKIWLLESYGCGNTTDWLVVRANNETKAREIAHKNGGDESFLETPWLLPEFSSCKEITQNGEEEIIAIGKLVNKFARS